MLWPSLPFGGGSGGRGNDVITGMLIGSAVTWFIFKFWPALAQYNSDDGDDDDAQKKGKKKKALLRAPDRIFASTNEPSKVSRSLFDETTDPSSPLGNNIKVSFLTEIMEQLWSYIKIAGADTIRASVEPSFAALPGPMKTCKFTKIDLGNIPIRMDNIVVHPIDSQDGMVKFDMDIMWDGECDIQLKADYIGSFGVRELKLSGRMAIVMKPLTNELPVVSSVQYAFINPPQVFLTFSGLASVAELSVLESTIQQALQSSLSIVVLPNRKLYKVNANNNFLDTYQPPLGVARVYLERGRGFVIEKRLLAADDIPDVYIYTSLGGGQAVIRSQTIRDNLSPVWNEVMDFCLYDEEQILQFHAWDQDGGPLDPDDDLGKAKAVFGNVLLAPNRRMELPLMMENNKTKELESTGAFVTVSCELCRWTSDLQSLENTNTKKTIKLRGSGGDTQDMTHLNEICGLLVVIINRAFDLPLARTEASTYVKVTYGAKTFTSKMIYDYPGWDSLNPKYDSAFSVPLTRDMPIATTGDESGAFVQLDLIQSGMDSKNNATTTILGTTKITFEELKKYSGNTITERRPMGEYGASLEFRVSLSGVSSKDSSSTSLVSPATSSPTRPLLPSPDKKHNHSNTTSSPKKINGESKKLDFDDVTGDSTSTSVSSASSLSAPSKIGDVQVTIVNGRGLKIQEELFLIDVPDVYIKVDFDGQLFTTSVQHNSITPSWNEQATFDLQDHGQIISVTAWDKNEREYLPDVEIGSAKTTVGKLLLSGGAMELEMRKDDRPTGVYITIRGDMV